MRKPVLSYMRTTKAQISLRIRGVISTCVVHCLDSIIPILSRLLASFWSWATWFESHLVGNPEHRFFYDVAHIFSGSSILQCRIQINARIEWSWTGTASQATCCSKKWDWSTSQPYRTVNKNKSFLIYWFIFLYDLHSLKFKFHTTITPVTITFGLVCTCQNL